MDLGPTLLQLTDAPPLKGAEGRSFMKQLTSERSGWLDPSRDHVVVGRELHFHTARDGNLPYPMRAIRTPEYLYIRNFKPERWPMGAPYNLTRRAKITMTSGTGRGEIWIPASPSRGTCTTGIRSKANVR